MSDTTWQLDRVPEGVRTRIEKGEVPLPLGDGSDPIRDLRYDIAVAEDAGDWDAVGRYNAQWMGLLREGKDADTWTPEPKVPNGTNLAPSRNQWADAARKAEEAGNDEAANSYKLKALRAAEDVTPEAREAASETERRLHEIADDPEASWADRQQAMKDAMRANAEVLRQQRGDPDPTPPPPPPEPLTVAELGEARREVEAEIRRKMDAPYIERQELSQRLERINGELLARERQRRDPAI